MAVIRVVLISACIFVNSWAAAVADGSVTLTIVDRLGRQNAALFSLAGTDGKTVALSEKAGKPVSVAAGNWRLIPQSDAALAQQIAVTEGQNLAVTIRAPDDVWLSVSADYLASPRRLLVRLKNPAGLASALIKFDLSRSYNEPLAARRPDVAPATAAAALTLARNVYARPAEDRTQADAIKSLNAHIWAGRILAAVGDAADVERLTANRPLYDAYNDLLIAARIERRLGTLDHGRVNAAAAGASERAGLAAAVLRQAGLTNWDKKLSETLLKTMTKPPLVFDWLAAVPIVSPVADQAFAAEVDRLVARTNEIAGLPPNQKNSAFNYHSLLVPPLIMRALLKDDDKALLKLSSYPIPASYLSSLALFVANPEAIARFMLLQSEGEHPDDRAALMEVASLCQAAELLDAPDAERFWRTLVAIAREAGARASSQRRAKLAPAVARSLPNNFANYFLLSASVCRPTALVAARLVNGAQAGLPYTSWIPRPELVDQIVSILLNPDWSSSFKWRQVDMVMETLSSEKIEAVLAAKGVTSLPYPLDVYLAYRRVATRANYMFPGYYEGGSLGAMRRGVTGRPYVLASKNAEGGVMGIASVRVDASPAASRFHVRLDQRAFYYSGGLIETRTKRSDWKFHPYTVNGGRRLISRVRLMRNGTPIELKEVGAADGDIVFAGQPITDWSGVTLEIDLAMFDNKRQLLFDLFADLSEQ
jgi:hypothetical protein